MTVYGSVSEALLDIPNATELWIDFARGGELSDRIGRLTALRVLHLQHCPPDLVLPPSLPALESLSLTGAGEGLVLPAGLEGVNVAHLEVSALDVRQLARLTELESLSVPLRDMTEGVRALADALPGLKRLRIRGTDGQPSTLPAEIEQLTTLEALHLAGGELHDLPAQLRELPELRELGLYGLPMRTLPEVVFALRRLAVLRVALPLTGLPPEMVALTALEELTLAGSLNGGAVLERFDGAGRAKMKPIPRVLPELTSLRALNLDRCGVVDAAPLSTLVGIESLSLAEASIRTCAPLASLKALETLSLEGCDALEDLSPLAALKQLHTLNIAETQPKSLSALAELPALRHLNVEYVECRDMAALYTLSLDTLRADAEVLQRWNRRERSTTLPTADDIIARLASADDAAAFGRALEELARYVAAASSPGASALETVLGAPEDEDELQTRPLPLVDAGLATHLTELGSRALAALFEATFRDVEDSYAASCVAIGELIRRQDVTAELRVVKQFQRACADYAGGHRFMESTVHDQLIDDFFPQFEAAPLAELLEWCDIDHLNRDGGDGMDTLFAPALRRAGDDATFERLMARLARYAKERSDHGAVESVDALADEIRDALEGARREAFEERRGAWNAELAASRERARSPATQRAVIPPASRPRCCASTLWDRPIGRRSGPRSARPSVWKACPGKRGDGCSRTSSRPRTSGDERGAGQPGRRGRGPAARRADALGDRAGAAGRASACGAARHRARTGAQRETAGASARAGPRVGARPGWDGPGRLASARGRGDVRGREPRPRF